MIIHDHIKIALRRIRNVVDQFQGSLSGQCHDSIPEAALQGWSIHAQCTVAIIEFIDQSSNGGNLPVSEVPVCQRIGYDGKNGLESRSVRIRSLYGQGIVCFEGNSSVTSCEDSIDKVPFIIAGLLVLAKLALRSGWHRNYPGTPELIPSCGGLASGHQLLNIKISGIESGTGNRLQVVAILPPLAAPPRNHEWN